MAEAAPEPGGGEAPRERLERIKTRHQQLGEALSEQRSAYSEARAEAREARDKSQEAEARAEEARDKARETEARLEAARQRGEKLAERYAAGEEYIREEEERIAAEETEGQGESQGEAAEETESEGEAAEETEGQGEVELDHNEQGGRAMYRDLYRERGETLGSPAAPYALTAEERQRAWYEVEDEHTDVRAVAQGIASDRDEYRAIYETTDEDRQLERDVQDYDKRKIAASAIHTRDKKRETEADRHVDGAGIGVVGLYDERHPEDRERYERMKREAAERGAQRAALGPDPRGQEADEATERGEHPPRSAQQAEAGERIDAQRRGESQVNGQGESQTEAEGEAAQEAPEPERPRSLAEKAGVSAADYEVAKQRQDEEGESEGQRL